MKSDRGFKPHKTGSRAGVSKFGPGPILCAVIDRHRLPGGGLADDIAAFAEAAGRAGLTMVQVREPDMPAGALVEIVARSVQMTRGTSTRVIVNDRLDVAVAAGADGVHLKSSSFEAGRVDRLKAGGGTRGSGIPSNFIVGRSVHSVDEAEACARAGGLDYLILGTIFHSTSKPSAHQTLGPEALHAASALPIAVLAIGGVNAVTIPVVGRMGVAGFAAIEYFAAAYQSGIEGLCAAVAEAQQLFDSSNGLPKD